MSLTIRSNNQNSTVAQNTWLPCHKKGSSCLSFTAGLNWHWNQSLYSHSVAALLGWCWTKGHSTVSELAGDYIYWQCLQTETESMPLQEAKHYLYQALCYHGTRAHVLLCYCFSYSSKQPHKYQVTIAGKCLGLSVKRPAGRCPRLHSERAMLSDAQQLMPDEPNLEV